MPIYTDDFCDDGVRPFGHPLYSSVGIGPKVTKAIDAATKEWLDDHPEATTTVEDDSITNIKLKDGSVNARVIEDGSVTTDEIADGAVTTPKIANGAVTTQKIPDGAITDDKLSSNAINAMPTMSASVRGVAKVGAGLAMNGQSLELDGNGDIATAVTSWLNAHPEATTTVQDGAITTRKIADGAIDDTKLSAGLKSNMGLYNASLLGLELGVYLATDGQKSDVAHYARTIGYVSKSYKVSVSAPYVVLLAAFDADGTYVGTYDGSDFVNTFAISMQNTSFDLSYWSLMHPSYNFVLSFSTNGTMDLDDLYDHLLVVDAKTEVYNTNKWSKLAYSALFGDKLDYSHFNAGTRIATNPETIARYPSRCVTDTFHVDGTQAVSVSGNSEGFAFGIVSVRDGATSAYDTGWQTDDLTVIPDAGTCYVLVKKTDNTQISPSDFSLSVLVDDTSLMAENRHVLYDYVYGAGITLTHGYYAVVDGAIIWSLAWARSAYYVPRHLTFATTNDYFMVLMAYDADDTYVGAWNGSGFSTTYSYSTMTKRSIDVHDVWSKYPQYRYKINFQQEGGAAIDLDNLRESILIADSSVDDGSSVPLHYVSHMEEKNATIRDNINAVGKNGETFIFITDIHWESNRRNSPYLVRSVIDNTNVRLVLCGGDIINTQNKDVAKNLIMGVVKSFDFPDHPMHMAFGNHDKNSLNWSTTELREANQFSTNEIFGLMQKNTSYANKYLSGTATDFYFDRDDSKTRFIFLDSGTNGAYGADTIPNLCTALMGTPDGYHVIIVQHWYLSGTTPETATLTSSARTLMDVVKQYNERGSYTHSGTTYDFASAGGQIVLLLGGHTHYDYVIDVDDSRNTAGVPLVCTSDDSYRDRTATAGTILEQCFDVITLDYTNHTIKCVRIGDGQDREISY